MRLSLGSKGNYSYACARVRAKKAALLTSDTYPKLLMMDANEIGRFLGETQYSTEMAELASKFEGVDLIEMGTSKNLASVYKNILSFCQGELREMISSYLARWDVWNVKTILRGKFSSATTEEIRESLVPAGRLREDDLEKLIAMGSVAEILDVLKEYLIEIPTDVRSAMEKSGRLSPIEDYLDKMYYIQLIETTDPSNPSSARLLSYVRREIDHSNLVTLLRLKTEGVPPDRIPTYFIPGGMELKQEDFVRLVAAENVEAILPELNRYSFFEDIKDSLERFKQTKSVSEIAIAVKKHAMQEAQTFAHAYPLSILPIIDYMIRKQNEVDNIRIIARGKESGLDSELIRKLLVI